MKSEDDKFIELMKSVPKNKIDKLNSMMEEMLEKSKQATEFKPGELTEEEEVFVRQNNLNTNTYISIKKLKEEEQRCLEHADNVKRRTEILSRSTTDPERIDLVNKESIEKIHRGITSRIDGYGYSLFVPLIAFVAWLIKESHGWKIGIFCLILMLVVLELSYRLEK